MPPLENMAFPSFAGFSPCAICAASYAKNDAIGFKRDNAQLTMCGALSVKHGEGFYAVFKVHSRRTLDYKGMANTLRKVYFLSFDCKGLNACAACMGLVGQGLALLVCLVCCFPPLLSVVRACLSCLPGRRAPAPCRVSAPAGHGHSIREHRKKCIVF